MMRKRIVKYSGGRVIHKPKECFLLAHKTSILFTLLAFFVVTFVGVKLLVPTITLKGKNKVVLNYKEKYKESGYKASFLGKDLTKKVKIKGRVNSNKLGNYEIVYEVNNGIFKRRVVRQVKVSDISAPVINLSSLDDIYVCPGKNYKTDSYSAFDNYDGDISKNVEVKYLKDKVIYTVFDKSGNKSEVSRKIVYEDIKAPEIKLNGGEVTYVFLNEEFVDKGAVATDNCDQDISDKIKVSGEVDTSKVGEYSLSYTVYDMANNKSEVKRKVIVSERGKNGTIYLTFDDGPKNGTTNVILDILKEEGVKATFFVTNGGPDELIKRAYDEGHSIALHTASHDYSIIYSSVDAYFNDLKSVENRVFRLTGYRSNIIRFPGGASNTISRRYSSGIMGILTKEVLNRGYRYYDWNISSGDASGGVIRANDIYNNVVSSLSRDKVNMVLMHDIKTYTRDALRDIIRYGKDNGYSFDKITEGTEMITQRVNN